MEEGGLRERESLWMQEGEKRRKTGRDERSDREKRRTRVIAWAWARVPSSFPTQVLPRDAPASHGLKTV